MIKLYLAVRHPIFASIDYILQVDLESIKNTMDHYQANMFHE